MPSASYTNTRHVIAPFSTATGKVQWLGLVMLGTIATLAIFAPVFAGYAPRALSCAPFEVPGAAHILGCDDAGYDIWSQLLYGARVSLVVGLLVAQVSTVIATGVAILVGYHGGWVDKLVMRFIDVVQAMPFMPLVIVLGVYFGASIQTQVTVIALVMWASPVRELRAP
jgi:ABC-type dipeptide/oligopeptide/nickel transport system permease subunit